MHGSARFAGPLVVCAAPAYGLAQFGADRGGSAIAFENVAAKSGRRSIAGMGEDFRDVDNDGRPDIRVVAMVNDTFPLFATSTT